MSYRDKIVSVDKSAHVVFEVRAQWDEEAGVWVAESDPTDASANH